MAVVLTEEYVWQQSGAEGGQGGAIVFGTITLDTSYPTSGSVIDPPGGVDYVDMVVAGGPVSTRYDAANKKLLCYGTAASATGLTEIANATNLAAAGACSYTAVRPA